MIFNHRLLHLIVFIIHVCEQVDGYMLWQVDVRGPMSGLGSPPLLLIMGIEPGSLGLQCLPADSSREC